MDLNINFDERRILVRGEEVKLTRIEWLLLNELAGNAGHLMVYYDLLARVWGPEYRDDVQILRTWISRLRQKIEQTLFILQLSVPYRKQVTFLINNDLIRHFFMPDRFVLARATMNTSSSFFDPGYVKFTAFPRFSHCVS